MQTIPKPHSHLINSNHMQSEYDAGHQSHGQALRGRENHAGGRSWIRPTHTRMQITNLNSYWEPHQGSAWLPLPWAPEIYKPADPGLNYQCLWQTRFLCHDHESPRKRGGGGERKRREHELECRKKVCVAAWEAERASDRERDFVGNLGPLPIFWLP